MTDTEKELLAAMAMLLVQLTKEILHLLSQPGSGYSLERCSDAINRVEHLAASVTDSNRMMQD